MKRVKRQERTAETGNGKEPQWWKKEIVAKIFVGLILSLVGFGIWFMQRAYEQKVGELQVICNVDSAKIFMNQEFKGFTQANTVKRIETLQSGVYILSVKKDGFASVDTSIKIVAGEITSIKANPKFLPAPGDCLVVVPKPAANSAATKPAGAVNSYQITITVHSKLKNADIMIDGKWEANAPATISLSKGRYRLRIENEMYYYEEILRVPSRNLVNVTEDEIKIIDIP